uniref:Uncharacterized protein n=1 Tax=Glossina austeni TaxID=7395 RepID=A0A1A9UKL6_GLOAU
MQESKDIQLATELISLGARLPILENETCLSRSRLLRLYKEVQGSPAPKGLLPFSADWFLSWEQNIHSSAFYNSYLCLIRTGKTSNIEAMVKAYRLYLELCPRSQNGKPILGLTRAWILLRFIDRIIVLIIVGYCVVFISVFGGFLLAEGQLGALFQPVELLIILGAGLGAFIVGNNGKSISATVKAFPKLFHSSRYNKDMYMDVMSLMYRLLSKSRQSGLISLEKDIDNPEKSVIFSNYPLMLKDNFIIEFLVDYLRLMISGNLNAYEIEALMNEEIETCEQEHEVPITSLLQVGDALPAFGIVAAVMGVVNALAAADRPAAELGELIAHAMVGTFLGILLAYGCVMPLGALLKQKSDEHIKMLQCIKITLLSSINGYAPQIAIEFGRKILYSSERPSFNELEEHLRQIKKSGLESRNNNATVNS